MVTLEAKAGSWPEDESGTLSVMHDEDNDDEDYTGDSDSHALDATDLRGVIRGRIANDSNSRAGLTSDESRAGVMVALYTAKKVGGSGTTKNNYVPDEAVTDDDGDAVMRETDGDGVFMFEKLVVGDNYFVKPKETDLYISVRNGNPSIGSTAEKATDVVPHALAAATLPPRAGTEPGIPTWDYHTSTATPNGDANFVLLYKDGEVEGKVLDPSVRAAHSRSVVELRQCKVSNQVIDETADPPTVTTPGTECDEYTGVEVEADVDARGNWNAEDLMEGLYEVVVDLPAGYINVSETGTETTTDAGFHSQQFVELMGGRADDDTETFHIKDRNAEGESELAATDPVEVDGTACTTGTATNPADNQCGHSDDGSFSVVVTAADNGATIRLSSSATDATPSGTGTYSQAVSHAKATTVTLPTAGTRRYWVHVASEDGYQTNGSAGTSNASTTAFNIRRDSDTRMNMLTISWGGDRIDLDRRDLGLEPGNPDGETSPVTGTTDLQVTLDKGDNGAAVPTTALSITVIGKNTSFDLVQFSAPLDDTPTNSGQFGDCPATIDQATGSLTVEANATGTETTGKGEAAICFTITDSDGESDADANTDNMNRYRLILTRK